MSSAVCSMQHPRVYILGSRDQGFCTSAVPPTNISRQQISSSAMKQHDKLQLLPLTANVDIHCRVILRKLKRSFLPCKEEDKLLHKISKSSHDTCKHYTMSSCLSHSVNYHSVQARSKKNP